jgi:hypothetical protein
VESCDERLQAPLLHDSSTRLPDYPTHRCAECALKRNGRPEHAGVVTGQVSCQVAPDGAPHEHRTVEREFVHQRQEYLHEKAPREAILLFPLLDSGRGQ